MKIFKAQPIHDQVIPDLAIYATEPVPDRPRDAEPFPAHEKRWRDFYEAQGKFIVDALYASLPGGTVDAVLVELLDRKRSIFKVQL